MSRDWQPRDWQSSITSRKIEKLLKAALGSLMSYRQKLFQPKEKGCQDVPTRAQGSHLCQLRAGLSRTFNFSLGLHTRSSAACWEKEEGDLLGVIMNPLLTAYFVFNIRLLAFVTKSRTSPGTAVSTPNHSGRREQILVCWFWVHSVPNAGLGFIPSKFSGTEVLT